VCLYVVTMKSITRLQVKVTKMMKQNFTIYKMDCIDGQGITKSLCFPLKGCYCAHFANIVRRFTNIRCIIDCTEVFIERAASLSMQGQTFSNYKHHNTVKFLVAITPNGCICFVSKAWGGRTSARLLTEMWFFGPY
jgi:hypothetical protein